MHETAQSMTAADLVIHGTFDLRRALDQYAQPVRHAAPPPSWPEPFETHRAGLPQPLSHQRIDRSSGT